jgi:hypothetical protein
MLVVKIMLAVCMFIALIVVADHFASRWTVEDPITVAERRHARRRRVRRARTPRSAPPPESPTRRPIQVVAADLRRLLHQMALVPTGATLVRWKALWSAYDGVLVEAAEMLGLQHELDARPPGLARDIERIRLLAALEDAGLTVQD